MNNETQTLIQQDVRKNFLIYMDEIAKRLRKRWEKAGAPGCAVELWFQEVDEYRVGKLAPHLTPVGTLEEGIGLLESWIEAGKPMKAKERMAIGNARAFLEAATRPTVLAAAAHLSAVPAALPQENLRLWLVLVDHQIVPGTQPILFVQSTEPTEEAVLRRCPDVEDAADIAIKGKFDLSQVLEADAVSMAAIDVYLQQAGSVKAAEGAAGLPVPKASSPFDTMQPWGANRSPLGRAM